MVKLKIKKFHEDAKVPSFANDTDAGMDIYSIEDITILPNHRTLVRTGLGMEFPKGYAALVWDKGGIAKNGVTTLAGVGDAGYRGEYKIVLYNLSSKPYKIKKGQKIAQILIQKIFQPEIELVEEMSDSKRGLGGFGSSGLG